MGKEPESAVTSSRRRLGCGTKILIVLALVAAGLGVAAWLALSEPDGWKDVSRQIDEVPEGERYAIAEELQRKFLNALGGIGDQADVNVPAGTNMNEEAKKFRDVKIAIPVRDANLWLMTQMPNLLKNQNSSLPPGVADPRVWIENKQLVLSCRVKLAGVSGIASFGLKTELKKDGRLELKINRVQTGKLRVPAGAVGLAVRDEFKKAKTEIMKSIGDAFDGTMIDPVFGHPGDKSRETRIVGFDIQTDHVDLTFRNGPRM